MTQCKALLTVLVAAVSAPADATRFLLEDEASLVATEHAPEEKEAREDVEMDFSIFPCDDFPKGIVKCDDEHPPKHLGKGSFGSTWLMRDANSTEQVVVKLFLNDEGTEYLTARTRAVFDRTTNGGLVGHECLPTQMVYQGPGGKPYEGAGRIRRCIADNLRTAKGDELLYVKLKDAGHHTLTEYVMQHSAMGTWTIDSARKAIKQVLEGVEALSRINWVHHDLSPWNMMVREHEGGFFVQIIDFGCSVPGDKDRRCEFHVGGVRSFMPPENSMGEVCMAGPSTFFAAFDKDAPMAFDAYSAALTIVSLLFSCEPKGFFDTDFWNQERSIPGDQFSSRPSKLTWVLDALADPSKTEALEKWHQEVSEATMNMMEEQGLPRLPFYGVMQNMQALTEPKASEFVRAVAQLLDVDAKKRPIVSQLLKMPYMLETQVDRNPFA